MVKGMKKTGRASKAKVITLRDVTNHKDVTKLLKHNRDFLCSALLTLYKYQTEEEIAKNKTIEKNGCGFNTIDASELSRHAKIVMKLGGIDKLTADYLSLTLKKYSNQIFDLIRNKELVEFKSVKNLRHTKFIDKLMEEEEREIELKYAEKKRKKLKTVKLEFESNPKTYVIKIGFEYFPDFVYEIKETRVFRYNPDGKYWYANVDDNSLSTALSLSFLTDAHKAQVESLIAQQAQ